MSKNRPDNTVPPKTGDLTRFAKLNMEWFRGAFPEEYQLTVGTKAAEECAEFIAKPSIHEAVDVMITMLIYLEIKLGDREAMVDELMDKLRINRHRQWEIMPDGTRHHVIDYPKL